MRQSLDYHQLLQAEWPQDIILGVPNAPGDSILSRGDRLVLAGEQKSGKSVMVAQMIRGLCLGTDWLGFPVLGGPRRVLYVQAELRPGRLKKRYMPWEAIARRSNIAIPDGMFFIWSTNGPFYLTGYEGHRFGEGQHPLDLLYNEIEEIKPDVLVIDPLVCFHDGEENSGQDLMKFLVKLDEIKERVCMERGGIAIVIVHHFRKQDPKEARKSVPLIERFRGSSVLAGWADSLIGIGLHEEPDKKYMEFTLRDSDTQPVRELTYNYESKSFDWEDPREELADWARTWLPTQPNGRVNSTDFCCAMHEQKPHLVAGRNWMTVAISLKRKLMNSGVISEEALGTTLWITLRRNQVVAGQQLTT